MRPLVNLLKKGQKIRKSMLDMKKPGTGINPLKIDQVLGRTAKLILKRINHFYMVFYFSLSCHQLYILIFLFLRRTKELTTLVKKSQQKFK